MKDKIEALFEEHINNFQDLKTLLEEIKLNIVCWESERDDYLPAIAEKCLLLAVADIERSVYEVDLAGEYFRQGV